MPRDSAGSYSSPSGQFVPNTVIDSNVVNSKLADVYSEITDSLSRSGKGGMTSPLRGSDGTSNLPAYAFSAETTLGLMRAGSGDLRVVKDGTDLQKWSTTEVRVYRSAFFANGLTVDAGGLTVTAGGATVTAGGLTVEAGGSAVAGATPAQGGVDGVSQVTASDATSATNLDTFALQSIKATTPGPSTIRLTTRTLNRGAVTDWNQVDLGLSYDVGTVVGQGGSIFLGKNGVTLNGGTAATAADPTNALTLGNGNLKLSGTPPNKDEALANTLTPANIAKAWTTLTFTTGGVTHTDGYNVTSAALTNGGFDLEITLAADFASANYVAVATIRDTIAVAVCVGKTAGTTTFRLYDLAGGGVDLTLLSTGIDIVWFGRQA